jgi:hypothetical protein
MRWPRHRRGALAAQVGKAQQRVEQVVVGGQFQHVDAGCGQAVAQSASLLLRRWPA